MTRKSPISFEGLFILNCEMQHMYMCYDQYQCCHVSLNISIIGLNI